MFYSIIIAIYNRKEELEELLHSLTQQTLEYFEVIVVDDGSEIKLKPTVQKYQSNLILKYYKKANTGPGLARNFGAKYAKGDYLLFVDSDCLVEKDYIDKITKNLNNNPVDAFGGSDKAHQEFNELQKAISYSMTSELTTGGIRGKKKAMTQFQPRSFNMGIKRNVFYEVGGFSDLRIGEDPDLSLRLWENGYKTAYFADIGVYHKRRNTLKSFAKQVYQFGIARPILNLRHPEYTKWVFWFPSLFYVGLIIAALLFIISFFAPYSNGWRVPLYFYALYALIIGIDATVKNKNIKIGLLSIYTSFLQLTQYGKGFLRSWWRINVLKENPKEAFPSHFYTD